MFDYVFCCMPEEAQQALRSPNANLEYVRRMQENLTKEKHGYRCSKCGRFIPAVQLLFRDMAEDGQLYARLPRKAYRYRKAADVFCGSHYYAKKQQCAAEIRGGRGAHRPADGRHPHPTGRMLHCPFAG